MWLYIWENVDDVTDGWHYHHDGGVVVVAPDLESARALLPEACGARTHDPDAMYRVDGNPPAEGVFVSQRRVLLEVGLQP